MWILMKVQMNKTEDSHSIAISIISIKIQITKKTIN